MITVKVKPGQLAGALKRHVKADRAMFDKAALGAAHAFATTMKNATDIEGITDTGMFKRSWKAVRLRRGAMTYNDAPYAGIIERGARPHKLSRAAIEAIARWVMRKVLGGVSRIEYAKAQGRKVKSGTKGGPTWREREALSIAYAIANKIRREGQKGTYITERNLHKASKLMRIEFDRLHRAAQSRRGRP